MLNQGRVEAHPSDDSQWVKRPPLDILDSRDIDQV